MNLTPPSFPGNHPKLEKERIGDRINGINRERKIKNIKSIHMERENGSEKEKERGIQRVSDIKKCG